MPETKEFQKTKYKEADPNTIRLVGYLSGLITIVGYIDDTGQELHAQRVIIAEEFKRAIGALNDILIEEHKND